MGETISQAEIEALLASLAGEPLEEESSEQAPVREPVRGRKGPGAAAAGAAAGEALGCEAYDFRRPDKFAKDQLRTLQMVHETFARLFASSLSGYLRVPVHVALVSVEQMPYDEYMRSLTNSIINIFSLAPLSGQAILEIEFNVVLSMIDRLLGGPGSMVKAANVLTDIERALTESILNRGLKELRTAWESIAQINPRREVMETQSQFVQIVPPNDIVVSLLLEIRVGEMRGAMSICIPYLLLKPITSKLSAQRWFASSVKQTGKHADVLARRLESSSVACQVQLGKAVMTARDVLNLKVGDVVALDRGCRDEVEMMVGSSVKFYCLPGIRGKKVAVHISRPQNARELAAS